MIWNSTKRNRTKRLGCFFLCA